MKLLLIAIKFAKGMGKTSLQRTYLVVSPLGMAPNSVTPNVKLLKFSAVAFSILIKTSPVFAEIFDEFFVQATSDRTITIKIIGRLLFIFFFMTADYNETLQS